MSEPCPDCEGKGWTISVGGYRSGCIDCDGTGIKRKSHAEFVAEARRRLEACKTTTSDDYPGWSINELATVALSVLLRSLDRIEELQAEVERLRKELRAVDEELL